MDLPLGSNIRKEIEPYILRMNSNLFKSKEKIERLEKALRFNANEKNYSEEGVPGNFIPGHTAGGNIQDPDFEPDFGHKANQALGLKP